MRAGPAARPRAGDVSGAIRRGKGRRTARVWATTIGGYQVMKKCLSYREYALLSRPLSAEEARPGALAGCMTGASEAPVHRPREGTTSFMTAS